MGVLRYICASALLARTLAAPPIQVPLRSQININDDNDHTIHPEKQRPLHGRFLHLTDFHPDRFYQIYSSTEKEHACHTGQGSAGIYGAESSDCDSPIALINQTMKWVGDEFRDKVDFVVWTGDSARHDNDENHPRNNDQVIGLNEFMVQKMSESFGKHNGDEVDDNPNNDYVVPIIPTFGNNDILPHNILRKGPNMWTRLYTKIWRQFIPEEQRHQFEQGGWFYVEVIPNKLGVFSINTLYFFTSNAAVDGCAVHSEPGYHQMEWLRIQLQFMRERGMKAILTGHVPPVRTEAKTGWDETCWQKYTLWLRQYRDVVVGSLYGHFNYDHFFLQDFEDLRKGTENGKMPNYETEAVDGDDVHTQVSPNYFIELRNAWAELPEPPKSLDWLDGLEDGSPDIDDSAQPSSRSESALFEALKSKKKKRKQREKERRFLKQIGGEYAERYAASFVGASVVPNLYPAIRVYEYNITGLDHQSNTQGGTLPPPLRLPSVRTEPSLEADRKGKKYKFEVPEPPAKSSPPGPAYSPQMLSWVRYTQYLANLTHINNDFQALGEAEAGVDNADRLLDAAKWKEGKHKGKKPHEKDHEPHPKKFRFEVHYDTKHDDVYKLKDLTMPNLVDLARRIGDFVPEDEIIDAPVDDASSLTKKKKKHKKKHKKHDRKKQRQKNEAWYAFVRRAFVETLGREELEEEFGE